MTHVGFSTANKQFGIYFYFLNLFVPRKTKYYLVNLKAEPYYQEGYSVVKNTIPDNGFYKFNPKRVKFINIILLKNFYSPRAVNGNFLDFLLNHKYLIPSKWQNKNILFTGTVYQKNDDKTLWVRCLGYEKAKNRWYPGWIWITKKFNSSDLTILV